MQNIELPAKAIQQRLDDEFRARRIGGCCQQPRQDPQAVP
jgi:hypothetical protein